MPCKRNKTRQCTKRTSKRCTNSISHPDSSESVTTSIPEPVVTRSQVPHAVVSDMDSTDIIDLTKDSPINAALRKKRSYPECNAVANILDTTVTVLDDDNDQILNNPKKPTLIIDLDTTLDTPENKLNYHKDKPNITCPICLENSIITDIKPMTTPCGHIFCLKCLTKISKTTKKCSICQKAISFKNCIRLYI